MDVTVTVSIHDHPWMAVRAPLSQYPWTSQLLCPSMTIHGWTPLCVPPCHSIHPIPQYNIDSGVHTVVSSQI